MENNHNIIAPQAGFQELFVRSNVDVVFGGGVLACGKAQPINSKVLTPTGFTTMGALKVGDVISCSNGKYQKVKKIFERGTLDCMKITFEDNTSVECCNEHLWTLWDKKKLCFVTLETKDIVKYGIKRYALPLSAPLEFDNNKKLPLDPYVLGVLLGDGFLGDKNTCVNLYTDEEIIERVVQKGIEHTSKIKGFEEGARRLTSKVFRNKLREMNLLGKHAKDKFIPKDYLTSSLENRKNLLRGLFDTDGYNDPKSSRIEYSTTSEHLAKSVALLVKSIGGKTNTITAIGKYTKDGTKHICNKVYRVFCRVQNPNDLFMLKRKQNGLVAKKRIQLGIKSIEYIGKKEMRCILVSSNDHLYITDGYNLTHNTFASILSVAEPSLDPRFRACFIRRTLGELKTGGGMVDDFQSVYGGYADIKKSDNPRITFPQGSFVEMRQINDENHQKVTEQWKGAQFDLMYMDELTSYEFSTFSYLLSRNRGKAKWTGKFRGTTNPERECWVRKWIDWYVGDDGMIIPERNGVVRYFYMAGNTINDVVWGDNKEQVYNKCRIDIDSKLKSLGGDFTYKNLIKSFTFYLGKMSENKASIGNNMDYAGSVAAVGGKQAKQLVEGNWNVSSIINDEAPIQYDRSVATFTNEPCINNDFWITVDLADTGTDNTIVLVWNGLHLLEYKVLCKSTPIMNVGLIRSMANKYNIVDNHIIYDGVRAVYVNDYIPDAIPFISYKKPFGKYWRSFERRKDDCYMRLVKLINDGKLSIEESLGDSIYEHQNINTPITFYNEFVSECAVVRFKQLSNGKYRLLNKKEMNAKLGNGKSMDVLDGFAMRMFPFMTFPYGEELEMSAKEIDDNNSMNLDTVNIYDESSWC